MSYARPNQLSELLQFMTQGSIGTFDVEVAFTNAEFTDGLPSPRMANQPHSNMVADDQDLGHLPLPDDDPYTHLADLRIHERTQYSAGGGILGW